MQFYNPLKPHLVNFSDSAWAVRRFSVGDIAWVYLDTKPKLKHRYWWPRYYTIFYTHPSESGARAAYSCYQKLLKQPKKPQVWPL